MSCVGTSGEPTFICLGLEGEDIIVPSPELPMNVDPVDVPNPDPPPTALAIEAAERASTTAAVMGLAIAVGNTPTDRTTPE